MAWFVAWFVAAKGRREARLEEELGEGKEVLVGASCLAALEMAFKQPPQRQRCAWKQYTLILNRQGLATEGRA